MKKFILVLLTLSAIATLSWVIYSKQKPTEETIVVEQAETSVEFTFVPDEGIRMEYASNPGARVNEDGSVDLLYENRDESAGAAQMISHADDGLTFEEGTPATFEEGGAFRSKQLPDGTWIGYGYNTTRGIEGNCLTSQSSTDGITFTQDDGCRYTLQEDDNGSLGVYDFFIDSQDNVVFLYLGDLMGLNNVRRAYSTDNGQTFTFTNDNVLGDEDLGGGPNSFVDEKVFVLPDHRVFLIAMNKSGIHGFLSKDDGVSFQALEEPLFIATDFSAISTNIHSLYDPQIVQLQDGRFRIYVAAMVEDDIKGPSDDDMPVILSATTTESF